MHALKIPARKRSSPPIVAMTLAQGMIEAVGAEDDDHRNDIIGTAMAVGEWLAEVGRPGRWDTLDVAAVLACVPDQGRERGRFLLTLAGLLGYAGIDGHLSEGHARRGLEQVAALAEEELHDTLIERFARQTARRLRRDVLPARKRAPRARPRVPR